MMIPLRLVIVLTLVTTSVIAEDEIERRDREVDKKICEDRKDLSTNQVNRIFNCGRYESVRGPEAEEKCQLRFFKGVRDRRERLDQWCKMDENQRWRMMNALTQCVNKLTSRSEGEVLTGLVAVPTDGENEREEEEERPESARESQLLCKEQVIEIVEDIARRDREVDKKICETKGLSHEKIDKILNCGRYASVRGPEAEEECQQIYFKGIRDKRERFDQWCKMDESRRMSMIKAITKCANQITSKSNGEPLPGLVAVPVDGEGEIGSGDQRDLESTRESSLLCKEKVLNRSPSLLTAPLTLTALLITSLAFINMLQI